MDPCDAADVQAAHAVQDAIRVTQAHPGKFEVPDWEQEQRAKLSAAIGVLMAYAPDSLRMLGKRDAVDPVRRLIGTAAG